MANIDRIRVTWSGAAGMPGVSTFYARDAVTVLDSLHTFFGSLAGWIPTIISLQVENSGDQLDEVTGVLNGSWTGDAQASIDCTGSGNYAAPSGFSMQWLTGDVVDGHHVRGRTYIVPIVTSLYEDNGTLASALVSGAVAAGEALIAANVDNLIVWHRPGGSGSPDGGGFSVSGVRVPDKVAVLRSRRD